MFREVFSLSVINVLLSNIRRRKMNWHDSFLTLFDKKAFIKVGRLEKPPSSEHVHLKLSMVLVVVCKNANNYWKCRCHDDRPSIYKNNLWYETLKESPWWLWISSSLNHLSSLLVSKILLLTHPLPENGIIRINIASQEKFHKSYSLSIDNLLNISVQIMWWILFKQIFALYQ